jgi:dinuclear metal center YbgI/SA1388 family protein
VLDERFPFALKEDWDNVGILAGDPDAPVRIVAVALTATQAVFDALERRRADLLITHHPVIFSPLKSIRPDNFASSAAYRLLQMKTAAISAHTNADAAPCGVSHVIARRLGLVNISPLAPGVPSSDSCRIVIFAPKTHAESVMDAVEKTGGARIGEYLRCSFQSVGTGVFTGGAKTRPFSGKAGREERVEEIRIETVAPGSLTPRILESVRKAHPYEAPVIDVIPLRSGALGGGIGAVGEFSSPMSFEDALKCVRMRLQPEWIKIAGPRRKTVRRVAVVGGSGGEFIGAALGAGADLFVTGDVKYHQAVDAETAGMPVADIGHASGEKWILPEFRRILVGRFSNDISVRIIGEKEPMRFVFVGDHREG